MKLTWRDVIHEDKVRVDSRLLTDFARTVYENTTYEYMCFNGFIYHIKSAPSHSETQTFSRAKQI